MAEIRLNKLIKKYNIGLSELVDFLRKQGAEVDESPNAKVSDEYVEKLDKQFGKDLEMAAEAAKLEIKLTNIIEKNNSSKAVREEEEEAEETISYKDNSLSGKKLAPAPAAEPEPAVSEQPVELPLTTEEKPVAVQAPVQEQAAPAPKLIKKPEHLVAEHIGKPQEDALITNPTAPIERHFSLAERPEREGYQGEHCHEKKLRYVTTVADAPLTERENRRLSKDRTVLLFADNSQLIKA